MAYPITVAALVLAMAAAAVTLDWVPSAQGFDRAMVHDRWLLRSLVIGALALMAMDPVAGLVATLGLLGWWRDGELRLCLLCCLLGATWAVAPALAFAAPLIGFGWLVATAVEFMLLVWHAGALRRWWPGRDRALRTKMRWLSGFHGQHTLYAASLAIILPLAISAGWPYGLALGLVLILVSSWVGIAAGLAGVTWVAPHVWPVTALLVGLWGGLLLPRLVAGRPSLLNRLPRGDSLVTVYGRFATWRLMLGLMARWPWRRWVLGSGWAELDRDLLRARGFGALPYSQGTAHNDVLEVLYAHGLSGALFLAVLAWSVVPRLVLGDPWSAIVVAGVVIALGSPALHYPSVGIPWWLACAWVAGS